MEFEKIRRDSITPHDKTKRDNVTGISSLKIEWNDISIQKNNKTTEPRAILTGDVDAK